VYGDNQKRNSRLHIDDFKAEAREGWRKSGPRQRAERALERQLVYQEQKSRRIRGREDEVIPSMKLASLRVRHLLEQFQTIDADKPVVEIGSGAHGLIFFFGAKHSVGVDPLAVSYARLFPGWQGRVPTVAAFGEALPFADQTFGVVICDNVVDHAESPSRIVAELVRILSPGGLLYFTVNVHHAIYAVAARAHSAWNSFGILYEIGPFADHTTHLTSLQAKRLLSNLPLRVLSESRNIAAAKAQARRLPTRHVGDSLKRLFFKNALYEVIARRET
jgi:SAM-dependent methyltransferase